MGELDFEDDPLPVSGYATIEDGGLPLEPPLQSSQEQLDLDIEQDNPMTQ